MDLKPMNLSSLPIQTQLIEDAVCAFEPNQDALAAILVGSLAKGTGDRVSDADILVFTRHGFHRTCQAAFDAFETGKDIFYQLEGNHSEKACFRKYLFGDMTSAEIHVLDESEAFPVCKPYQILFDKADIVPPRIVETPSPEHKDFPVYTNGDEGLIWELFDCIKWLSRGDNQLAKGYLKRLAEKL
ncbi:hypothetical protein TUMSATVNIG1_54350 [Vibrio nigripulchritudo]|nr:nucleotidyltransferase domain-containing protein [Vibrio nigripulchritudo]BCL73459.1 hypothetical protein VNTUMSATTG_53960 [Vibrio nigripulchritudo]BDU34826.1 hypothetical protein TUMSATVNIG1_54350 [Vibrio nigripulchritudo]